MRIRSTRASLALGALAALLVFPFVASAQDTTMSPRPVGENYRIELSGGVWGPSVSGIVAVEEFGIPATEISFVNDLGFKKKQFGDARLVLRAGRKHRFRFQYTPVKYTAESTLNRDLVFNGILYPVNIPVHSEFEWKVLRFGYEWDFLYTNRGFLGVLFEGRYTEMKAALTSPVNAESVRARAPLPSFGLVGRIYPVRMASITAEISGIKIPEIQEKYEANYADIDVYGTFNFMENFGIQAGWRRMNAYLRVEGDTGDIKFQGFWFGGAVRF